MSKQVYISADYDEVNGDREVVDTLNQWGSDNLHKVDFIDMSKVASGSVSDDSDCRPCDLKREFKVASDPSINFCISSTSISAIENHLFRLRLLIES